MKKTGRYIAVFMAAVMTAASSAATFANADGLTSDNSSVIAASATQTYALRDLLSEYISRNDIDAWIVNDESMPRDIVFVGYYREDTDIPIDIVTYAQSKGYEPQLINFLQEDHKKGGLIENTEVISRLIAYFISQNKLNARIVPEAELLEDADRSCVYVEYKADKADIPDMLSAYINERSIAPELVMTGVEGSLSKQSESDADYSFEEFRQLSEAKVSALFAEKGLTEANGNILWTAEKAAQEQRLGRINVLLQPNPFPVSEPEIADYYAVCWEQDRFSSALGLSEIQFGFKQNEPVTWGILDGEGRAAYNKYCSCSISAKTADAREAAELMAAALNYVQLNPYFAAFHFDYLGYNCNPTETVKGDANCDTSADMSDVVLVMQALSNPDKYGDNGTAEVHLTAQGRKNADMNGDGLTIGDAQAIQEMLLHMN
ncbi:MAG: dockerin type I repeat-containing protein [Ruminococcus sp.]|uniref:dockerin type I repeat-containing protein n=1 Tax=Ruminococcus sp. TaxID=41978 RepID=UPI0025E4CF64|nr:dockerin type I repeat-containing protein [Ruminococcus sp.]MCR5599854.1 dockerin type I repeat-containing protein [Ruminococcus sp.]